MAATGVLGAAPKPKAHGERVLHIERDDDGVETSRVVEMSDGGVQLRIPDDGIEKTIAVRNGPTCMVDAGALDALAKGCKRSVDCVALEPHVFGVDALIAPPSPLRWTTRSRPARRVGRRLPLEAVVSSGRMPDGGACPKVHRHSLTLGGCSPACVKGVCVPEPSRLE